MKNLVWGLGTLKPFTNHATHAYQALNIELLCPKKISEHDENLLDLAEVLELGAVVGEPDNSDSFQTRPVHHQLGELLRLQGAGLAVRQSGHCGHLLVGGRVVVRQQLHHYLHNRA